MGVARYGDYGKPVVFFPTGGGDFLDCERFLMVEALAPLILGGRIKLYAVDSVCRQSWTASDVPPPEKSRMQARYDQYLTDELIPFIRADCGGTDQGFAACGASIGAYNALNTTCKHPDAFDLMIGMSGTYVMDRRMHGYWDEDYYFNAPVQFVPHLHGEQLAALRRTRFVLGLGEAHENPDYTWRVASVLGAKGIWNRVETWGPGSGHDWPTWRAMLPLFLDRLAV
jgi:esterase/lipase superfamily enzyme